VLQPLAFLIKLLFYKILLFAIGLGALGIGGAVAIHLSLSLNRFQEELDATRRGSNAIKRFTALIYKFTSVCPWQAFPA
jgi:hypothetical protein